MNYGGISDLQIEQIGTELLGKMFSNISALKSTLKTAEEDRNWYKEQLQILRDEILTHQHKQSFLESKLLEAEQYIEEVKVKLKNRESDNSKVEKRCILLSNQLNSIPHGKDLAIKTQLSSLDLNAEKDALYSILDIVISACEYPRLELLFSQIVFYSREANKILINESDTHAQLDQDTILKRLLLAKNEVADLIRRNLNVGKNIEEIQVVDYQDIHSENQTAIAGRHNSWEYGRIEFENLRDTINNIKSNVILNH